MLDVHPPHESTHTWKDFWIHLGTIAAGLLLAIGLEQSVEALHHVHQHHQLERDLHNEAVRNDGIMRDDIQVLQAERAYALAVRANVEALQHGASPASLHPVVRQSLGDVFLTSAGAWSSARDSSQLALLSREQTSVYEEIYAERDFLRESMQVWFKAQDDLAAFATHIQDLPTPAGADVVKLAAELDAVKLTPAQRDEFSTLLTRLVVAIDRTAGDLHFYQMENNAVIEGVESPDELHRDLVIEDCEESTAPSTRMECEPSSGKKP